MIEWIGKRLKKDNKGFTLIELVVVIAILAILAGIAVPRLTTSRKKAAVAAHNANVKTIESAATMYIADGGEDVKGGTGDAVNVEDSDIKKYLQDVPTVPKGAKITGDGDVYKIKIDEGKIEITPYLRYIDSDGNVTETKQ